MKCAQAKPLLSPYLDGAVTGMQMHALGRHLEGCTACNQEYAMLRQTQQALTGLGRRKAPPDLALRLRVAISREAARTRRPYMESALLRLQNVVNACMVPAMAGLAATVAVFALLMGFMAPPLQADEADVPLLLNTAPQLQQSAFDTSMATMHGDSLVIEAYVDENGRVQDYRILSDSSDPKNLPPQVKNMLMDFMTFTTFRPATYMGRPTPGRAVFSFSKVSVRG
ncbi:MAG TPA: zf-HC2 domain-containing protein [Terriglobales bacterium]|nr:zf-HC2 domain-containing protein [Terriglobales bacterium]